jgi:hypothetical protein
MMRMSDLPTIADRVEIEVLRAEFTDTVVMRRHAPLTSLFAEDGAVQVPHFNSEALGREAIRAGVERL